MEKKKKKISWSNLIFVAVLVIILFTPLGTEVKVWVNRLFAWSPSLEKQEGRTAVDFDSWTLTNEAGQGVEFSDFKGRVVLVNFWATWCPPCIAEKPSFQKLYDDYKDRVVFLFVTTDQVSKVKQFKDKHNYSLPVYYPASEPPVELRSSSIPASFVIDKKGDIVVKKFKAADWNSASFRADLEVLLQE